MKSLQQVLWRGVLALSLMAVGVGSGLGMPPVEQVASPATCPDVTRILVADQLPTAPLDEDATLIVLHHPLTPAG